MQFSKILLFWAIPYLLVSALYGDEVTIRTSQGQRLDMNLSHDQTVLQLKEMIEDECGCCIEDQRLIYEGKYLKDDERLEDFVVKEFFIQIGEELDSYEAQAKGPIFRPYEVPVCPEDKKDIRFVVTTLANKPLTKLMKYKPQLEDAGERIEHVHPLRFFQCIFSDDELIVGIRNIRKRGWVWDEFKDNAVKRLQQESERDNLYQFVSDFAHNIGIDQALILPALNNKQWEGFVNILIQKVPRKGESDRYDQ